MFGVRACTQFTSAAIACAALALGGSSVAAQGNPQAAPAQAPAATQAPPAQPQAAGQPPQNESPAQVTNVGGRWELNWRQSDKPPDNVGQQGRGEPGEGGGGGRRGGGGGGGMGGRMGRGGGMMGRGGEGGRGGRVDESARESMREMLQAPRTLLIVEHPDHVTITDENGQVEKLEPNGQKVEVERAGKQTQETTHWDGRTLVSETTLSDGTKVTRTFQKAAEGLQLIVTTKVENSRVGRPIELKRVYDQALEDK